MRLGEVCGAVSGAVMVIGFKYGFNDEQKMDNKGICYSKTVEFMECLSEE